MLCYFFLLISVYSAQKRKRNKILKRRNKQSLIKGQSKKKRKKVKKLKKNRKAGLYCLEDLTPKDLKKLNLLSRQQIKGYYKYIKRAKALYSIYELQAIPYWDKETVKLVSNYCYVRGGYQPNFYKEQKQKIWCKIGKRSYKDGSKNLNGSIETGWKYQTNVKYSHLNFNFTLEQKKGESWLHKGFVKELLSAYMINGSFYSAQKSIFFLMGHFRPEIGQGLLSGNPFSLQNPQKTTMFFANGPDIRPSSSGRKQGIRGLATIYHADPYHYMIYGSWTGLDVATHKDGTVGSIEKRGIAYIYEKDKKKINQVYEGCLGFASWFANEKKPLQIGCQYMGLYFSKLLKMQLGANKAEKLSGQYLHLVSTFGHFSYENIFFWGEVACKLNGEASLSQKVAVTTGMALALGKKYSFSCLFRHYSPFFDTVHGKTYSQGTLPKNEIGLAIATQYRYKKKEVIAIIDCWKYPSATFFTASPRLGSLWKLEYKKKKNSISHRTVVIQGKYVQQHLPKSEQANAEKKLFLLYKHSFKIVNQYSLRKYKKGFSKPLIIKHSFSIRHACNNKGHFLGIAYQLGCKYRKNNNFWNLESTIFYAPHRDITIYLYSYDLVQPFSFPPLMGYGIRLHGIWKKRIIWKKKIFSQSTYTLLLKSRRLKHNIQATFGMEW